MRGRSPKGPPDILTQLRALVRRRAHWLLVCDAHERPFVDEVFAAVNARVGRHDPRVRIDILDLDLHAVDAETGDETCAGTLFVVAIPRPALSAETLQALLRRRYELGASCEDLRRAQFITPMRRDQLWAMGERLRLFTEWLRGCGIEEGPMES